MNTDGEASPKSEQIELFQETLNTQFYNSTDWWTIQEETSIGTGEYSNIDVRINTLVNSETGLKLGDDWKRILFKDINHDIEIGRFYIFNNSTWLTINSEVIKNLAGTCAIRRCNNTLRWIDQTTGAYYEEPCCIEYLVKEPRDYFTTGSAFTTPGGFLHIYTQLNNRTSLIDENQRFLFGNSEHWTCYKVVGTGLNDFNNTITYDNSSAKLLVVDMIANFINEQLDDVANGIADVYTTLYTLDLNKDVVEGAPGTTAQLFTTITYNRDTVTRPVTWATSDSTIAVVSTDGLVSFISAGSCTITATITGNTVGDTCMAKTTLTPAINAYIVFTPNENYVLESDTKIYSVYLYKNDVIQADTFTITCSPNDVPATSYIFTQTDGHGFSISNRLRSLDSYLTITCTSGTETIDFEIYLRGAWQNDNTPYA